MKIGILSDSHGRAEIVRRAVALLERHGAERLVHCGDIGGMEVFDQLVGRQVDFVWGNSDQPDTGLNEYLRTVGLSPPRRVPLRLEINGKHFAVWHGHEPQAAAMLRSPESGVDYLLHGHTHTRRNERLGGARIINPGALHRALPKTVAILDLHADQVTFLEVA